MVDKIKQNTKPVKQYLLENLPLVLAVIITIANLYIASLLAPIKQDIDSVRAIAEHNQEILINRREDIESIDVILDKLDNIIKRLDRIENKLF